MGLRKFLGFGKDAEESRIPSLKLYSGAECKDVLLVSGTIPNRTHTFVGRSCSDLEKVTTQVETKHPSRPVHVDAVQAQTQEPDERNLLPGWSHVDETRWSLDLLQAMDWKLFEELCAEIFRQSGFEAKTTGSGADGGIDIIARKTGEDGGDRIAVQCKRYRGQVKLKEVREFLGAGVLEKHKRLIFITSSSFNQRALSDFSEGEIVKLVDGQTLLRKIKRLGKEVEHKLLQFVVEDKGGWQTPTCPRCDVKMIYYPPKKRGAYWGCANFPKTRCRITMTASRKLSSIN